MTQDNVFKALADSSRRTLLDVLFQQDGRSLWELQQYLAMSRFGVMKHLHILEGAGLITTRKVGREKLHYLNRVPIQLVYDRWVNKFARPWTAALAGTKYLLEEQSMSNHTHVYEILIRTSPEKLWQALTDGAITSQYYFGTRVESTWKAGEPYCYVGADGFVMIEGMVNESDPPRCRVTSFMPKWVPVEAQSPTTVIYEIEAMGPICKLRLTHEGLTPGAELTQGLIAGWAALISSLKSLLETGEPLPVQG